MTAVRLAQMTADSSLACIGQEIIGRASPLLIGPLLLRSLKLNELVRVRR